MFLKKSKKSYKGKGYETYALTESYREGGKVKHKHVANLGTLTPEQAERIRLVLKAKKLEEAFVGPLKDVVAKKHFRFLDVAVLDQYWRLFALNDFFSGRIYPEAMAINRCLEPKSKIRIKAWTEGTVLSRLTGDECPGEYEVYRDLDEIATDEERLQQHLYQQYVKLGLAAEKSFFYDITSSYFEGSKCILATYGYSRDHRPDRKQIVIALVITPEGYPLYWRVMRGNIQDVTTVSELVTELKERFGIKECLLVFDRGMMSMVNLQLISEQGFTYISALDRDEIMGLGLLEPDFPERLDADWKENLTQRGFKAYDDHLYYRKHDDLNKRYLIAYNRQLYQEQQEARKVRLAKAKKFITALNEDLARAKKSRSKDTTKNKIDQQLHKLKMHKIFAYRLEPVTVSALGANGKEKKVGSFHIAYSINETALKRQGYLDGLSCFLTNAADLKPEQVISAYRRKNKIEEAFREIKSFLQVRPFYLTREERVRAHVSICVLGYLLLNALEESLSLTEQSLSGPDTLEIFGRCLLNRIGPKGSDTYVESITEPAPEQLELLSGLGLEHLVGDDFMGQLLEHSTM